LGHLWHLSPSRFGVVVPAWVGYLKVGVKSERRLTTATIATSTLADVRDSERTTVKELFFLTDSFPADWESTNEDKHLGELLRGYWSEFAKTGDPNFDGAPQWPASESDSAKYFEIGAHLGLSPVSERVRTLEATMRRIVAELNRQ
jgi:hypothetical protein